MEVSLDIMLMVITLLTSLKAQVLYRCSLKGPNTAATLGLVNGAPYLMSVFSCVL